MVTFLVLTWIAFLCARVAGVEGVKLLSKVYLAAFVLLLTSLLEVAASDLAFFKSDEIYYLDAANPSLPNVSFDSDRYLWVLVNKLVHYYDLNLWGGALKIINIPILAILYLSVYTLASKNRTTLHIWILLPYLTWLSIFNFRDVLILCLAAVAFCLMTRDRAEHIPAVFAITLSLVFLRPASAAILLILVTLSIVWTLQSRKGAWAKGALAASLIGAVAVVALNFDVISQRINSYQLWLEYLGEHGFEDGNQASKVSLEGVGLVRGMIQGIGTYLFAPIPTSLLQRLFNEPPTQWGVLDDVIRMIHQSMVYLMSLYIIVHMQKLPGALRGASKELKLFLVFLVANTLLYSFYMGGVGHSRVKMFGHLAIFIVFCLLFRRRSRLTVAA